MILWEEPGHLKILMRVNHRKSETTAKVIRSGDYVTLCSCFIALTAHRALGRSRPQARRGLLAGTVRHRPEPADAETVLAINRPRQTPSGESVRYSS